MTPNQKKTRELYDGILEVQKLKEDISKLYREQRYQELADLAREMADAIQFVMIARATKP